MSSINFQCILGAFFFEDIFSMLFSAGTFTLFYSTFVSRWYSVTAFLLMQMMIVKVKNLTV